MQSIINNYATSVGTFLNHIGEPSLLSNETKTINIEAISNTKLLVPEMKLSANFNNARELHIGDKSYVIKSFTQKIDTNFSFRIVPTFDAINTLNVNFIKYNNEVLKSYFYAFADDCLNNTYINNIIQYIVPNYTSKMLLSWTENGKYYVLQEKYNKTLVEWLFENSINESMIDAIINNILSFFYEIKKKDYDFNYGALSLENIYAANQSNNIKLTIENFESSSIFYHGIRFSNKKTMGQSGDIIINIR